MPVDAVRDAAVRVLLEVFEKGTFLDVALDKILRRAQVTPRGRRFLTQLVYGTVRYRQLCDHALTKLVHQPLEDLPRPIQTILRMGVFQSLFCNQVTFPAMVHTSVDLARKYGHAGTARLVNAVLRRAPHSLDDVKLPEPSTDFEKYLSIRHSMPSWLVRKWLSEHGSEWAEQLCVASNTQSPVTLRVNLATTSVEQVSTQLARKSCKTTKQTPIPEELTVIEGEFPSRSKLFQEGHFIFQDPASMLPPHLLEPQPGEKILDLCAAPGGKTTHLAQLVHGESPIVALDLRPDKFRLIRDNIGRLGVPGIMCICGDGTRPPFAPGFDRILVDAPCSGLGTLRRHPDLKWRLRPEDPAELAELQRALLRTAIRLCKNGGRIVYSVCTFTREETEEVVGHVLEHEEVDLEDGPEWLNQWRMERGQYQTLPQRDGLDGFFLTRLRKRS
ncbi:MAG: 16S rRNA (cytosine(967)-C(5))-methyltransferase RsmB [Candidatus Hydrogenedentes bacterium]|nr:16S rRNA (cytosine(967)-C(5))-methyltransferase RsmB [Candidatus Hydrogenedentota bacterium]